MTLRTGSRKKCSLGGKPEIGSRKKSRGGKPKRKLSAYNRHVSKMMKSGMTMKQAAEAWKSKQN